MGRKDFWTSDGFLDVIVTLAAGWVSLATLVKSLKRKAYALRLGASPCNARERSAFFAIYDPNTANIRPWFRSQDVDAQLIRKLTLIATQPRWIQPMTACVVPLTGRAALTTTRFLPRS
jgi:hypothetical protein